MPQLGTSSYALFGRPGAGVTTAARYLRALTGSTVAEIERRTQYEELRGNGFVMVRIDAPLVTRRDRLTLRGEGPDAAYIRNIADSSAYKPDYNIVNDESISELCEQLIDVVNKEARRT